jgi:tetratricopeptide (TPR) repeat protein
MNRSIMSEWYDYQKRQSSNFRKLLQERIEKANPRRNLTAVEAKRLAKLEAIADKLKRGENVQNRQLQTWLSDDEYAQIEVEWKEQLELRGELKDKPSDLKRYEEKLKQATFNYNRAEGYSNKRKHNTAKKFYNKSESLCQDALEILQEILHYDSSLLVWFDRDISFEVGSDLSADIDSLPRLVTSRSHEKQKEDSRITNKQSVKLAVVERAMHNIGRETVPVSKDDVSKLDKFLNTDD